MDGLLEGRQLFVWERQGKGGGAELDTKHSAFSQVFKSFVMVGADWGEPGSDGVTHFMVGGSKSQALG